MITLSLKESGALIGTVDEADLELLIGQLEEESDLGHRLLHDLSDHRVARAEGRQRSAPRPLKEAVGDSEGVDLVWTES